MDDIYFDEEDLTTGEINRLISNSHENELLNDFYNMKENKKETKDGKTDVL